MSISLHLFAIWGLPVSICFSSVCLCISVSLCLEMKEKQCICKNRWKPARVPTYIKLSPGTGISSYLAKTFGLVFSISPSSLHSLRSCLSLMNSLECRKAQGHNDTSAFPVFNTLLGEMKGAEGRSKHCIYGDWHTPYVFLPLDKNGPSFCQHWSQKWIQKLARESILKK